MDSLKNKLKKNKIIGLLNAAKGCSSDEVKFIEGALNIKLPECYKNFLRYFGHGMGKLFQGTDFEYKYLVDLQDDEIKDELRDCAGLNKSQLDDVFIFMMHQGYITLFFYCSDGEDPSVYRFREGDDKAVKISSSFYKFLNQAADDFLREENNLGAQSKK